MLDKKMHEQVMGKILFAIYSNENLAQILGFKGGTACYLFYALPRFSTDLDFNLLNPKETESVYEKIKEILAEFGTAKNSFIKVNTIFSLLSYQKDSHNIKIEISRRISPLDQYEVKNYLGLPILVMKKDCIFAHKLIAVLDRKKLANRDLFDIYFFLKNNWPINEEILIEKTGLSVKKYLKKVISFIEKQKSINILHGLGEIVDEKQKQWIKEKLIKELLFLLKLYLK